MRRSLSAGRRFGIGALALTVFAACGENGPGEDTRTAAAVHANPVERGAYLVEFGGCADCHSPKLMTEAGPVPDSTRHLSGHPANESLPALPAGVLGPDGWGMLATNGLTAFAGPWGVSFGTNLTPDPTGLGRWTEDQFIRAMRTGKHMGDGRDILPPMPWFTVRTLTDDDLRAVFAYLRSLPPVSNAVPTPIPPGSGPAQTTVGG